MSLRRMHQMLGAALGLFVLLHLANHAALFWGVEAHMAVQAFVRPIYQNPVIEPLLIAGFCVQIWAGLVLVWRRGWPKGRWARLQVAAGLGLGFFLLQHITAALWARHVAGLETTIHWAASVVGRWDLALYFAPYYGLGIAAVFAHLAAACARRAPGPAKVLLATGAVFALAFVATLTGAFFDIPLPSEFVSYRDGLAIWSDPLDP